MKSIKLSHESSIEIIRTRINISFVIMGYKVKYVYVKMKTIMLVRYATETMQR